ncbi:hypothetical protein I4U23_015017 [Adineta vaga]|nr:hypothetical protein I4U23_015017 [Adineta vaga]
MDDRFSPGTLDRLITKPPSQSQSKRPFIILGILLVIFITSTIVLAILYGSKKSDQDKKDDDVCLSPYCIKAADYLIDSIDQSIEPCEDFYQFSCGTWLKNTRIPDDASAQNTFRILDKKLDDNIIDLLSTTSNNEADELHCVTNARRLYSSCVDEATIENEGIHPILSLINTEFGGWPILQGESWNNATFNLSKLLLKLRQYNYNFIYRINTDTDEKNSSISDISVGQGSLGLPQRQYYANETDITIAYRQFMRSLASLLTNDTIMIDQDVDEIFEFERSIAQFYWTNDEQRARDNETVRTTISDLAFTFNTSFDFTNYLQQAYLSADVVINDQDTIVVSELDFLNNATSIIDETSSRTLQNYFIWRFMMNQAGNMPRSIRNTKEQFDRTFQGTSAEQARTVKCGIYVNNNMGFVVSKLYIKKYFDENARNQSLEMIEHIRDSFIVMLDTATWMDDTSKAKAMEKAMAIGKQIGYPDYLGSDNNTKLEKDYEKYVFNSSYIYNIFKIQQIKTNENLQLLRKAVDRKAWGTLPPTVINAFYEPSQNQITFPAGILQMPFFNKDAPKYLNYGGIGLVIGHEITHGFDDTGRQFDKDGNRIPWWSDQTIDQFNQRKQCIIDQYSNFSVPSIHMNSNGNQTQGEDIADNGGVKAAFFAYQQWAKANANVDKKLPGLTKYSVEQLFFINFAHTWCIKMTDAYARNRILTDVHSLGQFRITGPTSNFDEFDRAFGCKPGQGNSRVNKCVVW